MSTPSIKVGQGNWGIKATRLLGYANTDKKFVAREFTVGRLLNTATRVNASGSIQAVNADIPRIDYFGGQASLLVEPSAANGILNSTDTTTSWTLGSNLSRATIDVIGVSGTNLTVNATGTLGSDGRISRFNNNFSLVSGSTYTISFFIKKTGTHTIGGYYANITGAAGGDLAAGFDVSGSFNSGLIYGSAGITSRTRRVEQWGTDVFRCSETFTMTASGTLSGFFLAPIVSVTSPINSANGTQLGFAAPQVELGSVPTSFIPTTTGSVTRNADVISLTGVAGLIGQTEGTIYAEVDVRSLGFIRSFINVQDASYATNAVRIESTASNQWRIQIRAASVSILDQTIITPTFTTGIYKIAMAYNNAANGVVFAVNGAIIYTSASALTMPSGMDRVHLGTRAASGAFDLFLNDRIRAVSIYQTRLPNTTTDGSPSLQSITTL